ncbi:endonuclease/exonuclease/phosphatase family protein [Tolypothrix sp. FACHB-123]|uniref:endonuclease/exonuclease/phosphatase family protein n=1 Tax=Tolypothrix sp. FACHB-123 TaxID=2692868 RepID=UPI0016853A81|nr:endonuclease/exonuclease/phosphatase family protein [Tolypothrix sp. FACHB-123]MBD2356675.1 endonuclease/exonuclease/phosphatase family protein [Tolypothrix sp. FACHB-123]
MVDLKEKVDILAKKFVPSYRFLRPQESTIDRSHILQTELNASSIKVLNWNIAKKTYDKNWLQDFLNILEQYQPDLIFLQEFRLDIDAKNLKELINMSWNFAPNFIDAHHQSYSGILTAAKISPLHKRAIITKHYEPIIKTPKVSLIAEYSLSHNQNSLLTINSHLINFVNIHKFKTQLHELEIALSTHQGPIIFSGDFNTWSQKRALLLYKVVTRLGLTPVAFTPHHSKKIKRFLLSPPLDYIFYRGLKENKASARVLENINSSDHKPLLAEFSYIQT